MAPKIDTKITVSVLTILSLTFIGCLVTPKSTSDVSDTEELVFKLRLDRDVYLDTVYGEAPQVAIWIENTANGQTKNIWVSYRTGTNDWVGKSYCDICLPYWQEINGKTKENKPYHVIDDDKIHAYTMATPSDDVIKATARVPQGSEWNYYIEVNVSGDFNAAFPSRHPKGGYPDLKGNGQPSIIYQGSIVAMEGQTSCPEIIGRTEQWEPVDTINEDITGITTASKLLKEIKVTCKPFS